jgi:EAL domain-containing protein (putative c-di-GMP-specific phosphodiesterase class I)
MATVHPDDLDAVVEQVATVLETTQLAPHTLVLEITESVLMQDAAGVVAKLEQLKALGVRLAIDDFGTGYSSLSYLQQFPIDILKIDQSFVSSAGTEVDNWTLAQAIVQLGKTLNLQTVAEGVEDATQCTAMRRMGCDSGQGYLFARPLDTAAVSALLNERNSMVPDTTHSLRA